MKKLLLLFLLLTSPAFGQGLWNGFDPQQTASNPLQLRISDGDLTSVLGTSQFKATNLVMAPNATNYVYLDLTQNPPQLVVTTAGFPTSNIYAIAIAVTNTSQIVTLTDSRPSFNSTAFSGGGGGGGTGTINAPTFWSTQTLLGSVPGCQQTGTVESGINGSSPACLTQGLPLGNGGSAVTSCPYTVQPDTAAATVDRNTVLEFNSSSSCAVTLDDPSTTGMAANFAVKMRNVGAGAVTVSRQTSATFSILNGSSAVTTGATSFTLTTGQFATVYSDNTNWRVDEVVTGVQQARAITGSTSSDTILATDLKGVIEHDFSASAGVTESIPTPTTLLSSNFSFTYVNHAANEVDALAPSGGWHIRIGTNGTPLSNTQVQPGTQCHVYVDPNNASSWIADCSVSQGNIAIINGICYTNLKAFSSLDGRWNACNTDNNNGAVASHIIDARAEGNVTQNINSQMIAGSSSNNVPALFLVPPDCTWDVNSSIGSSSTTGNAIFMYSGAAIVGDTQIQSGGCQLVANFTDFSVYSFINTNNSIYWYIKGLETYNPSAFTASGFNNIFTGGDDMSGVENVNGQAYHSISGTITTSGTTATCVTNCSLFTSIPAGNPTAPPILINNVLYFITANASGTLTITPNAGTQTAVPFTYGQWDEYLAAGCCGFKHHRVYYNNLQTGGGDIIINGGGPFNFDTDSPAGHASPGFPGLYCTGAAVVDVNAMYFENPSAALSTVSTTSISGNQYTLTWVSGQQFWSFYTGAQLTISGNTYTVQAGFSNTSATITSNVGTPSTVTGVQIAIPFTNNAGVINTNCRLHIATIYASAVSSGNGSSTMTAPLIQQTSTGASGYRLDIDHMFWNHGNVMPEVGLVNLSAPTTAEQTTALFDTLGNFGAYHDASSTNLQSNYLTPNSYDRIQGRIAVQVGKELQQTASSTVASASSISPSFNLTHITGSTTINTINLTNLPNVIGLNGTLSTNSAGTIATLITGPTFGFVGMLPGWNLYISGTPYVVASVPVSATGTVNTDGAGTTITYSTGTNFANLQVGAIVTIGGSQTTIQTITSNTSMTVSPAVGINLTGSAYTGSYVFITSGPASSVSANYTALPALRSTTRITLVMDGTAAIGIGGNITSGLNPITGTAVDLIYDPLSTACAVPTQGTLGCWMPEATSQTSISTGSGPAGYSGAPSLSTTPTFVPFIGGGAGSATVGNVGWAATSASPISGLQVAMSATPPTTAVYTLTDGSTGEALTCTVTNPATTCSDLVHSFTPAVGDKMSWNITLGSSTQTPTVQIGANYGAPTGSSTTGADLLWNTGQTGYLPGTTVATTGIPVLGTSYVYKVIPNHNTYIGHASMYVSTGQASGVGYVCIYKDNASANVWNTSFAVTTSTAVATGSATQYLLQAGVPYYIAAGQFGSATGATVETWDNTLANLSTLINTSGNFFATGANGFSGAACPATLGTLTNITASNTVNPIVLLGP